MQGGDIAFVQDERQVTHAEFHDQVGRTASLLRECGLDTGDVIGVALHNRPEFFVIVTAASALDIKVVPMAWRLKREEVSYLVEDSGAKLVIYDTDSFAGITELPGLSIADYSARLQALEPAQDVATELQQFAMQLYSSGTTGKPKAIEREAPAPSSTQAVPKGSSNVLLRFFGVDSPDNVHMMCGPLYHSQPIGFANSARSAGQRVVMMSDGFDAEACLALIAREKVSWITCVPTHLIRILALPENIRNRYDISSLKAVIHSAAPCPVDMKKAAMEFFPVDTLWELYGGTEGMISMISPQEWAAKPGSVGKAFPPGSIIEIRDTQGNTLPTGEHGLIYAPPLGKWRYRGKDAERLNAETFQGDFFTLGDVGYLDEDGYLFITDRLKDMIISGGSNIYPAEVEATLFNHPAVADAAVIGVPDKEWGESVLAIVEPKATVTAAELITYCREHLAHYKCPKEVELVEHLPREPSGKIKKRLLRDNYWENSDRSV